MQKKLTLQQLSDGFPPPDREKSGQLASTALAHSLFKVVVLDDDPTGIQTVHDVSVYTDWKLETVRRGFEEDSRMFFILTNSRGLTAQQTEAVHCEIARNVAAASRTCHKDYLLVSRGDSTLRGHYPLETATLRRTLEETEHRAVDGEVLCFFFPEGGRYTAGNIHYVQEADGMTPTGETEFAKDRTFGYTSSNLGAWIAEKTQGEFPAESTLFISIDQLRARDVDGICKALMQVSDFRKVVVNALDYADLEVFTAALLMAVQHGKRFLYRTAAAFTKVIGGVSDKPLLTRADLIAPDNRSGGLIVAGSHVKKTTAQLERLKELSYVEMVEFNQHLVLDAPAFQQEIDRVIALCERNIGAGKTTAVFTRRARLDLNTGNKEDELRIAIEISDAVTSIVTRLRVRPGFLIAKGGITSSDIGTKGLGVTRARVMGQVRPGIPVWQTGDESKFPGLPYVIFPGNVGAEDDLKIVVETLSGMTDGRMDEQ